MDNSINKVKRPMSVLKKMFLGGCVGFVIGIGLLVYNSPSGISKEEFEKVVKEVYQETFEIKRVAYHVEVDKYTEPYKVTFSWRDDNLATNKPVSDAYKDIARREMVYQLKSKGIKKNDFEIIN